VNEMIYKDLIAEGVLEREGCGRAKVRIEYYTSIQSGKKVNHYYKLHLSGKGKLASFIRRHSINNLFTFYSDYLDGRFYGYIILSEKGLRWALKKLEKWFKWIEKPDLDKSLFLLKLRLNGG